MFLQQTRQLRHGIMTGQIETPGNKETLLKKKLQISTDDAKLKLDENATRSDALSSLGRRIARQARANASIPGELLPRRSGRPRGNVEDAGGKRVPLLSKMQD